MSRPRTSRGFTLVELMIVVAIIGILAAVAIPQFIAMQLRAKRSEVPTNLSAIRTAQKAYHHEWGTFTSAGSTPSLSNIGRLKTQFWCHSGQSVTQWEMLGWKADGDVYGSYQASNSTADAFTATGKADIDGDSTLSQYQATQAIAVQMSTANNVY